MSLCLRRLAFNKYPTNLQTSSMSIDQLSYVNKLLIHGIFMKKEKRFTQNIVNTDIFQSP
jgi:hypothetical protein